MFGRKRKSAPEPQTDKGETEGQEAKPTLVFCGTPDFSVPCLKLLHETFGVACVVSQPDKPVGRGMEMASPAVKDAANELSIPCFQPKSIKSIKFDAETGFGGGSASAKPLIEHLNKIRPIDAFIVVAYGKMIPRSLMDGARCGVLNVHASLLPRWRGAAPIQSAVRAGDERSGVSIMQIDEGLDTGPVFTMKPVALDPRENTGSLHDKLSTLGAQLLCETLPRILEGTLKPAPQEPALATHAPKWEREDAVINWNDPAEELDRQIRACAPRPGARANFRGNPIKIYDAQPIQSYAGIGKTPGTVVKCDKHSLIVAAGGGSCLELLRLQLPGKRPLDIAEFLAGAAVFEGEVLS
ncbi:MAG: methionyl-tRNA formyltransferase [Bdellovibrionales bacterium]|nr:methionyl-tRNA formyltransferase [Bdellovibrionales bacterium]